MITMKIKNTKIRLLLAVLVILVFPISTIAATINVPADYIIIQDAIDAANSGDTVQVAAGTYSPSTNGEVFPINMKDGVELVGDGAGQSILDAEYTNRVVKFYGVGASTKIQGFTITRGGVCYESGAGILIEYGDGPTIDSCLITNNGFWSDYYTPNGGGIRVYNSAPQITNCTIVENEGVYGAGVYIYSTPPGKKAVIANCTISNNEGSGYGAGIYMYENPTVDVINSITWGNTGGFYSGPPYDDVQLYWGNLSIHYNDTTYYVWYPSYSSVSASNNFYADPLFMGGGDYHLTINSPCIGAGTYDLVTYPYLPYYDIDGDIRQPVADIGSDQYAAGNCTDNDGDGYYVEGGTCGDIDCDDDDADINPGEIEVCNGVDDDCNSIIDDGDTDGDRVTVCLDMCPDEDATGFDANNDGCIDNISGLRDLLETLVAEGVIEEQLQNSLLSKVDNALKSADKENICTAINQLEAFKNEINAQRGKKIADDAAYLVIEYTDNVIDGLLAELPPGDTC